ncbi:MAG: ATPase with strong ADP affinity, partial [uncultured bacterium]
DAICDLSHVTYYMGSTMKNLSIKLRIPSEEAMLAFGSKLATSMDKTAVIFLYGPLGAGKTTLSRGFLQGLGYRGRVKSPTYTLVEPYELAKCKVYHFDFYRIRDPHELHDIGIQDYVSPHAICLIEWPEQGAGVLPSPDISCYIEVDSNERNVKLIPHSTRGETILHRFEQNE